VRLASRGLRDMDQGPQAISQPTELQQVRRQARAVYIKSVITAAFFTAIALIP